MGSDGLLSLQSVDSGSTSTKSCVSVVFLTFHHVILKRHSAVFLCSGAGFGSAVTTQ